MDTIARLDKEKHRNIMLNILVDIYRDFDLGTSLVFKWGTACYFVYGLDRFSTDLDFDLIGEIDESLILEKINTIIWKYGTVKNVYNKRNTLFSLLSYGDIDHNIKIEISKRWIRGSYHKENWHSLSMLVMDESSIFTNKLFALTNRASLANRDIYDIYYFFRKWVDFDQDLLEQLTTKNYKEYFRDIILFLDSLPKSHRILEWLGEVLNEKQKIFVKNDLVRELRWFLEMRLGFNEVRK